MAVKRVGFIGLGNMGNPLALNAVAAGFEVMVYDLRDERMAILAQAGAKPARTTGEVGRHGEVVQIAVVDDAQVESVVLGEGGVLGAAAPGAVIAVHSTIHPKTARRIGEAARGKGVGVVDAQMSGGEKGAKARTLCFMVGGERRWYETCRPVLAASGKSIFHMGDLGTGATTKLAQQTMVVINILAAYEGMRLATGAGIDPETFLELVRTSAGQSQVADNWLEQLKSGAAGPDRLRGRAELFYKGLCPVLEFAGEAGVPLPGVALTRQLLFEMLAPKS
jgi:3-hydroxyisobutyrate dehydrogenase-like beta-hydroxyacid dehydrogenase